MGVTTVLLSALGSDPGPCVRSLGLSLCFLMLVTVSQCFLVFHDLDGVPSVLGCFDSALPVARAVCHSCCGGGSL